MAETLILIANMWSHLRLMASGKKLESFSKALWREMNRLPHLWQGTPDFRKPLRFQKSFDFGDHDSWSQKVSQRGWRQQKCVIICVMDLVEWMILTILVELKSNRNWHITKSPLFLGCFVGTPNSCQNLRQFFEVNAQKSVERQTFQLSLRIFFSIQKMVTTWCFPQLAELWSWSSVSCSKKLPFFFGHDTITCWCLVASLFPMKDLCFNGFMLWKSAKVSWVEHLATTRTRREDLGCHVFSMSFGGQWWNATELMWAKYGWLCQRIANGFRREGFDGFTPGEATSKGLGNDFRVAFPVGRRRRHDLGMTLAWLSPVPVQQDTTNFLSTMGWTFSNEWIRDNTLVAWSAWLDILNLESCDLRRM